MRSETNNSIKDTCQRHWQRNVGVLDILVKKQCDLSKPRVIENVFYTSDKDAAKRLRKAYTQFECGDIEFKAENSTDSEFDLCLVIKMRIIITTESLNEMTDVCVKAAHIAGCEYDGWYTKV